MAEYLIMLKTVGMCRIIFISVRFRMILVQLFEKRGLVPIL